MSRYKDCAPQSVPVHVVAHSCLGSSLENVTAREHELAASASHLKLPVPSCSCKGFRSLSTFQVHAIVKVSHQHDTPQSPPTAPVLLLYASLSRAGLRTNRTRPTRISRSPTCHTSTPDPRNQRDPANCKESFDAGARLIECGLAQRLQIECFAAQNQRMLRGTDRGG